MDETILNLNQSKNKAQENRELLAPNSELTHSKYFKRITELQAGDIIVHAQCKFCNHPLRAEAEAAWEKSKGRGGKGSYAMVIKVLNDKSDEYGVKFNYQNISVHLNHHYEQQVKRMWLREYGRHLVDIVNYKIGKEEMFEGVIQAFQLKLFETAADPDLDPGKQADMMVKLGKGISEASLAQAKLRGDVNTLDVYKEKVQNIMVNFIAAEAGSVEKKALLQKLDLAKAELSEDQ